MSAWEHGEQAEVESISPLNLGCWLPDPLRCRYCGTEMERRTIGDIWPYSVKTLHEIHSIFNNKEDLDRELGIPEDNIELDDDEPTNIECHIHLCRVCGWWLVQKDLMVSAKVWQIYQMSFATSGALRTFKGGDLSQPLSEVRQFLCARYESRFSLHPRVFEETVASVFEDLGYRSTITTYSNDGGIDVVLSDSSGVPIGVQVKRYKNNISVEEIRSFLGALTVGNYVKGLFVTTSKYQRGAKELTGLCQERFVPIELVDADRFFELLKIAQLKKTSWAGYPTALGEFQLQPVHSHPLNSS